MGGYGSGPRGSAKHATVEQCCALDCAWLRARGAFRSLAHVGAVVTWTRRPSGETAASVTWESDLRDPTAAHLWLRYQAGADRIDERVALESTRPGYGGVRWWFGCPGCGRRCAKLCLPRGAARFRCRRCYRLAYDSQRETRPHRLMRRAHALWRRAGADIGRSPREPQRPKWMRRRTYRRLCGEAERLDRESLLLMFGRFVRSGA